MQMGEKQMAHSGSVAAASVSSSRGDSLEATTAPPPLTSPLAALPGYSIMVALPSATPTRAILIPLALTP